MDIEILSEIIISKNEKKDIVIVLKNNENKDNDVNINLLIKTYKKSNILVIFNNIDTLLIFIKNNDSLFNDNNSFLILTGDFNLKPNFVLNTNINHLKKDLTIFLKPN